MKTRKNSKKWQFTESAVTPTHGGFRSCELDTVAGLAKRVFLREGVVQGRSRLGQIRVMLHAANMKTQKTGELLNRPELQRTTHCDTQNWTRWLVRPGASFCERVLFRDGPDQGHVHTPI